MHCTFNQVMLSFLDKWREYPVNVTAYSYFFGAVFMGLASIYYYNQPEVYVLPNEVCVLWSWLIYLDQLFRKYQPNAVLYNNNNNKSSVPIDTVCAGVCHIHHFCPLLSADHMGQHAHLVYPCHCFLATTGDHAHGAQHVIHFHCSHLRFWWLLLPRGSSLVMFWHLWYVYTTVLPITLNRDPGLYVLPITLNRDPGLYFLS